MVSTLKKYLLGLVVMLAPLLAGCGGSGSYGTVRSSFVEYSAAQRAEIAAGSAAEYKIQAEDVLFVAVGNQPELNQEGVLVLPDGTIGLIGVDQLMIAGLTVMEADSLITRAYSSEYRDPDISVIVRETRGRLVYVLGEVRSPGLQRVPRGGLDVVGAVAMAGGFTGDASPEATVLVRVQKDGYLVQEIDLSVIDGVEAIGLASLQLLPYDVVYVPRSRPGDFAYFSRAILAGLVSITRMASDLRYLSTGTIGRF